MLPLAMDYLVARVAGTGGAIMCLAVIIALLGVAALEMPGDGNASKLCFIVAVGVACVGAVVASASGFVAIWTSDTLTYVLKSVLSGCGVAIFSIPCGIAFLVFEDGGKKVAARTFSFAGYCFLIAGLLVMLVSGAAAIWLG